MAKETHLPARRGRSIGIARAAITAGLLSVISFTLEKNRKLRSGGALSGAIETVDAATGKREEYRQPIV
ncbi:MAG: hypothetical protein R3186_07440 [Ruegeria sp.]|nr:hypothetical protein [Ruegeria sp.]